MHFTTLYRSGTKTAFDEVVIEMTCIKKLLKAQNIVLTGMALHFTKKS